MQKSLQYPARRHDCENVQRHLDQTVLFPESIDAYIKPDAPVRLISHIVDQLDLTLVMAVIQVAVVVVTVLAYYSRCCF